MNYEWTWLTTAFYEATVPSHNGWGGTSEYRYLNDYDHASTVLPFNRDITVASLGEENQAFTLRIVAVHTDYPPRIEVEAKAVPCSELLKTKPTLDYVDDTKYCPLFISNGWIPKEEWLTASFDNYQVVFNKNIGKYELIDTKQNKSVTVFESVYGGKFGKYDIKITDPVLWFPDQQEYAYWVGRSIAVYHECLTLPHIGSP